MSVKVKKARVFSAKFAHSQPERPRPFSGVSTQAFHRQELIENTYASQSVQPSRAVSARPTHSGRYLSGGQQMQKQALRTMIKPSKKKQQMIEQILTLKQTVNKLVEELSHERGKVEMIKRKNSKYSKILSMQFANEQQWSSQAVSNHLVTGIKTMYDQLKQKYEQKSREHEQLLAKALATNYLQLNTYISTLESNNKELKKKLEVFQNQQLLLPVSNQSQRQANAFMVAQLKLDRQKHLQKLKEAQSMLKKNQENSKDLEKKISFLQKLILEKDNNIHALQGKIKHLSKQNNRLNKELATVAANLTSLEAKHQEYREFSTKLQSELSETHKIEMQGLEHKKDQIIQALEKNNSYLQEIVGQLRRNNTQLNSEIQNIKEEVNRFRIRSHQKSTPDPSYTHRTAHIEDKPDSQIHQLAFTFCVDHEGNRIPQKADKKHHEEALKKRKVDQSDVIEAIQLLKYKMISQNMTLEQVTAMFDYDLSMGFADTQWSKQYVTMRQIKDLLTNKPFSLNSEDAVLLARYLIEDVHQQHVYCDQLNQNDRSIVKSIIKNLLQPFRSFNSESISIQKEIKTLMVQYASNLQSALTTLQPSGLISSTKFSSVLKSLGIDVPEAVEACLIAKMALHSDNIKKLPFRVLF